MQVLFIRHAVALEREEWFEDDLLRPLSPKGEKKGGRMFAALARHYEAPQKILTSRSIRAKQTAELVAQAFGGEVPVEETELLNPGCDYGLFKKLMESQDDSLERIVIVGHEPDFSMLIAQIVAAGVLYLSVKKASCIEIEMGRDCRGELKNMISPKLLMDIRG